MSRQLPHIKDAVVVVQVLLLATLVNGPCNDPQSGFPFDRSTSGSPSGIWLLENYQYARISVGALIGGDDTEVRLSSGFDGQCAPTPGLGGSPIVSIRANKVAFISGIKPSRLRLL